MVKKYFLTYAIKATDLDETGRRIAQLLGMNAVLRTSSYVGNYVSCEGSEADRLTITQRNRKYFPPEIDYKLYSFVLYAQNTIGKNNDKEQRHNNLKAKLAKMPGLLLLSDIVEETKN